MSFSAKAMACLRGVAVLGNPVAGAACEHEVVHRALSALADFDHFRDATKMIRLFVTC
jgi:hypothetical protein